MANDESKVIRPYLIASQANDFGATFQLSQMYEKGIGVKQDPKEAKKYKSLCAAQLANYEFRLKSIKLINYKGFTNLNIPFSSSSNCTILVGNNGCGKSTILEAIKKTLTHVSARLATQSYNGDLIDEFEIKKGDAETSTIISSFALNEEIFTMEMSQTKALTESKKKSKYTELTTFANILRQSNSVSKGFSFPLLASYTVDRANDVTTKDIDKSEEILDSHVWDQSKAYSKSLNGKADFKLFFRWFKELVEANNANNSQIKELTSQLKVNENLLKSPFIKGFISDSGDSETGKLFVEQHKAVVQDLRDKINSFSTTNDIVLDSVCNAIYKFLPGFSNLQIQRAPLDLTVEKDGIQFSVLQLSQGEKSLLALVADIGRRLALLNPNLEAPLDGTGIVLIDEIDLHLHPMWQQKIVKSLESTFKNLQFIVTTHSPQVCQTIDSKDIWLIKEGRKFRAPKGTRGAVSSWVLKNLFDVEIRPPEDEFVILLKKYKELVYADKYNSFDATSIYGKLSEHFGSDYEDLVELDLYIENKEWENDFEED